MSESDNISHQPVFIVHQLYHQVRTITGANQNILTMVALVRVFCLVDDRTISISSIHICITVTNTIESLSIHFYMQYTLLFDVPL